MRHFALFSLFLGLLAISSNSCMVPYHLPKVTLTECFTQSFSFLPPDADLTDSEDIRRKKQQYPKTLEKILRIQNKEQVSDLQVYYAGNPLVDDLMDEKIISKGISVLNVSLVPGKKPEKFFVSGNGQYDIINTNTSEVYYSARFWYIDSVHYSLDELRNNPEFTTIPVFFDQVLINHMRYPSSSDLDKTKTWEHKPTSHIRINIQINRSIINKTKKPIFSIDYSEDARHEVSVLDTYIDASGQSQTEYRTVGYIKFCPTSFPYDKIIDLRGLNPSIRRDYWKFKDIYEGN